MEDIHLMILGATALAILIADHDGVWYMLGKKQTLSLRRIMFLHRAVGVGLLGMIATGALMVGPYLLYFLKEEGFLLKMFFVAVLVVNSFYIGHIAHVAAERPFALLTPREKLSLMISGGASAMGWIGAATIGFFFL